MTYPLRRFIETNDPETTTYICIDGLGGKFPWGCTQINSDEAHEFALFLKRCKNIQHFVMLRFRMTQFNWYNIIDALKHHRQLETFDMSKNTIMATTRKYNILEVVPLVTTLFGCLNNIRFLNLSDTWFSMTFMKDVCCFLKQTTTLRHLNLDNIAIDVANFHECITLLCEAIEKNRSIRSMKIRLAENNDALITSIARSRTICHVSTISDMCESRIQKQRDNIRQSLLTHICYLLCLRALPLEMIGIIVQHIDVPIIYTH